MNPNKKDFLIEIGLEELPTYAVRTLRVAFEKELCGAFDDSQIAYGKVQAYATPRRLALLIKNVATTFKEVKHFQGPPYSIAFDKEGNPTAAGLAFAKKAELEHESLLQAWRSWRDLSENTRPKCIDYHRQSSARATETLLCSLIEKAVQ